MTKVFDKFEIYEPSRWEKFLLKFCHRHYSCDFGSDKNKGVVVVAKTLFGKIYIMEVREIEQ